MAKKGEFRIKIQHEKAVRGDRTNIIMNWVFGKLNNKNPSNRNPTNQQMSTQTQHSK